MAVTIYTKTGCPHCAAALIELKQKGLPFEEINVTEEPGRLPEMVHVSGGRKVPVIVEDGRVTVGHHGAG